MKKLMIAVVVLMMAMSGVAQAGFICEQIKDKKTRAACIEDRVEKEKTEAAKKEKSAEAEEKVRVEADKRKELDEFIRKSKEVLTKNYKDPMGAQYTNLVVSVGEEVSRRVLCGSVNGKNSYGAYVGAQRFYVRWYKDEILSIWTDGDSTQEELEVFVRLCLPSEVNVVTQIDSRAN